MRYQINDLKVNDKKHPTLWVVDNFYDNPDAVRNFALTQDFHFSDYHRGRRTEDQFEIPGTKESLESIMGLKITNWMETHGMCGRFQHCTCEDALVYHADAQKWAATVYLTPDAPYECGTSLLAHKKTGIRHVDVEGSDIIWANRNLDPTPWEHIDVVANVYNRLVIWDGHCPHAASKYFGYDKYDSRLFHMFFFDTEQTLQKLARYPIRTTLMGFIVGGDTQNRMRYSTLDRLIFVGSFVWVAHWATKLSELVLNFVF